MVVPVELQAQDQAVQAPAQVEAQAQVLVQVQPIYPTPLQKVLQMMQYQKQDVMQAVDIILEDTGISQFMMLMVML